MSQYLPKDMNEWMRRQEKRISSLERRRAVSDALAEWGRRAEAILPILDSRFHAYSSNTDPTVIRRGNVVDLVGSLGSDSVMTGSTITDVMEIPAGFRPAGVYSRVILFQGSQSNRWAMTVAPSSGRVDVGRYGPGASSTNTWMPFSTTWTTDDDWPA